MTALPQGWLLAAARLTPALLMMPPLNWAGLPAALRVALGLGLALFAAPMAAQSLGDKTQSPGLLLGEVGSGVLVGATIALPFWALQVAGALGQVASGAWRLQEEGPFGEGVVILGLATVVALRGPTWIVAGLAATYGAVPVGGPLPADLDALAQAAGEMLGAGVVMLLPLLALAGLAHLALALAGRGRPDLLGVPVRPVVVILGLAASVPLVGAMISRELQAALVFLAGGGG